MPAMEIELLLIAKLQHGLDTGKPKFPLRSQIATLTNLYKDKLDKVTSSSPISANDLSDLREELYDLTDIMHQCRSLSSIYKKNTLDGRQYLSKTKSDLIKKTGAESNQQINSHPISANAVATSPERPPYARKSYPTMGKFHGFEENVKAVTAMVMKRQSADQFKAIAITGKNGIGKTALAQLIFNKEEVKNKFWPRIWVCTSKQANEEPDEKIEIVTRILKSLGIEEKIINHVNQSHQLEGLIYFLHLNLKGKRFLLVLDDIWRSGDEIIKWHEFIEGEGSSGDKLSHGLPKDTGGTVIVTTKEDDLAEKMVGKDNLYKVLSLSNQEDCLLIFRDEICQDGVERNFEKLKKDLLRNCAGVPLAAKVVGRILAEEIEQRKLKHSVNGEVEQQGLIVTREVKSQEQIVTGEVESQEQIVNGEIEQQGPNVTGEVESQEQTVTSEDETELPVSNEIQVAS